MLRLIDAGALYKTIDQEANFYGGFGDNVITASELRRCIETVPTIDAVPVVHAEWKINADGYYPYCSACKKEPPGRCMTAHCPSCGAKMDGGKNGAVN